MEIAKHRILADRRALMLVENVGMRLGNDAEPVTENWFAMGY